MKVLGINSGRIAEYSADVLSEVFGFGDMEYLAGMKLFNKVIDRLGVGMEQQKRYEVFDRIYEEGMRERSSSEIRIVDRVHDLGAMAWAIAPELFCEGFYFENYYLRNNRKKLRKFIEKEHMLW